MLISLGVDEVNSILQEQGMVEISCEFCDSQYRYDAVDIAALFKSGDSRTAGDSTTRH